MGEDAKTLTLWDAVAQTQVTLSPVEKSEADWRAQLSPLAFDVLRKQGTERAFSSELHNHKGDGVYACAGCGTHLYDSRTQYDSGTGWPSYYEPVDARNVGYREDRSFFSLRTEVHCARCGGHLGHVFTDGPAPTGKRHCINAAALTFLAR